MSAPHDRPEMTELVEAVREFLAGEVEPQVEGRLRYLLKVAGNVLAIVERELQLGPEQAVRHAARLERLGFGSDAELAHAIRAGELDGSLEQLEAELKDLVADKLAVARPGYDRR